MSGDVSGETDGAGDSAEERPVYVARSLAEAQRVEAAFTAAGLAYEAEPDTFQGGIIFRSTRVGVFFYVEPDLRERAFGVLKDSGFRPVA